MEADSGSGEIGSPSGAQSASVTDAGLDASSLEEGEDDSTSQQGDEEDDLIEQGEILVEQGEIPDDDPEPVHQDFRRHESSHAEEYVDQPASPDPAPDTITQESKGNVDDQEVDTEDDGEIQDDDSQDGIVEAHGKGGKHAESDEGELVDEDGELTEDDSEEETKHVEEKRVNGHDWYGGDREAGESKKGTAEYSSRSSKAKANGLEESLSRAHITDDHQEHVELDYDEDVEEDHHSGKSGHVAGDSHRRSGEGAVEEEEEGAIVDKSDQEDGEIGEGESEDGELSEEEEEGEGEEGEIKDSKKQFNRPVCKYYHRGNCTWGDSCKFIHVGVNDNDYAAEEEGELEEGAIDDTPTPGVVETPPTWPTIPPAPQVDTMEMEFIPPESPPKVESAWERGLRHAKEIMKRANKRKETEANFEEKKMNMGLDEAVEREVEREPERVAIQKDPYYDNIFDEDEDYFSRSAKEQWASGRYENFEVRWTREYPQASPPPQAYMYRSPSPKEDMKYYKEKHHHSHHHSEGHSNRHHHHKHHKHHRERRYSSPERKYRDRRKDSWREDVLEEPMVDDLSSRPSRGDEWKDPWMRSKPPTKPRVSSRSRSRSRGRAKHRSRSGSYSSYSSRSRSRSRSSSRSSFSSRSSRSRSSSFSSRSRSRSGSRSRSRTPTPFRDKARLKKPPGPVSRKGVKEPLPPGTERDPPLKEKRPIPPPSKPHEPPKSQISVNQMSHYPGGPPGPGHPKQPPHHKGAEKRQLGPSWAPKPEPALGAKPMASGRGGALPGRGRRTDRRPGKRPRDSLSSTSSSRSRSRSLSKSSSSSRSRSRSTSISSRSSISSSSSSGSADSEHLYRDIKADPKRKKKKVPTATLR